MVRRRVARVLTVVWMLRVLRVLLWVRVLWVGA